MVSQLFFKTFLLPVFQCSNWSVLGLPYHTNVYQYAKSLSVHKMLNIVQVQSLIYDYTNCNIITAIQLFTNICHALKPLFRAFNLAITWMTFFFNPTVQFQSSTAIHKTVHKTRILCWCVCICLHAQLLGWAFREGET